jgi:hypothetical protein
MNKVFDYEIDFYNCALHNAQLLRERRLSEIDTDEWLKTDEVGLNDLEQQQLQYLKSRLLVEQTHLMNEATLLWSGAIYPLLSLAEQGNIRVWAGLCMLAMLTSK